MLQPLAGLETASVRQQRRNLMPLCRLSLVVCLCVLPTTAAANDLPRGAILRFASTSAMRHASPVMGLALIDGGKTVLSNGYKEIVYWDIATGRAIKRVPLKQTASVAVSRDGRVLIVNNSSGGAHRMISVCRAADATEVRSWQVTASQSHAIAISFDGKRVALAGISRSSPPGPDPIEVWDIKTGKLFRTLHLNSKQQHTAYGLAFSPDGKTLASGGGASPPVEGDTAVHLWDLETGKVVKEFVGHQKWIKQIRFSDDGQWLAAAGTHETRIWEVATGKPLPVLKCVAIAPFAPNKSCLATGGYKPTVFNPATGATVAALAQPMGYPRHAVFSPDGKILITGDDDGLVRVWDPFTGKEKEYALGHRFPLEEAAFSADGRLILTGSKDPRICMWDAATGVRLRTIDVDGQGPDGWGTDVEGLRFTPDGEAFFARNQFGKLTTWSTATGRVVSEIPAPAHFLLNLDAMSQDGEYRVSIGEKFQMQLSEVRTGKLIRKIGPPDPNADLHQRGSIGRLHLAPDGNLYANRGGEIQQWDSTTGKYLRNYLTWSSQPGKTGYAFSADGKFIACSHDRSEER